MKNLLPFETSIYDDLPVNVFIYKAVMDSENNICDYRIVYGNKTFISSWKKFYGDMIFFGASVVTSKLFDDKVLSMMKNFYSEEPHAFSTYLHDKKINVHLQPILNLPKPYGGFIFMKVTDYEESVTQRHFLHSIKQMQVAGVLLREKIDGSYECVFASKEFAQLMECSEDEALKIMSGKGYIWTTYVDDRLAVKRMFRRKISEDGKKYLTIRKITAQNNVIWCKVYYSFIEEFGESYVYGTYFDVTSSKVYAERLRTTYMTMGNSFYRENERTLGVFRVNITKNKIEDLKGRDLFTTDSTMRPYSEVIRLRAISYTIEEEQEYFLRQLSVENLTRKYLTGQNQITFLKSDMFENLTNEKFDIIVSNPPYIKKEVIRELENQVQKEPHIALDGGIDGLDFYRDIIKNSYKYLKYEGYLCLEIGFDQKNDVIDLIEKEEKFSNTYSKKDLFDNDRIVITQLR